MNGTIVSDNCVGLWDFARKLYEAPGVVEACLFLQDRCGVNVPVLLFAAWVKQESLPLSPTGVKQVTQLTAHWHEEIVTPLRALRRKLKSGPKPAPSPQTNTLRDAVKAAELSAERIELDILETEGLALISAQKNSAPDDHLLSVVRHYHGSDPDGETRAAIAIIERALTSL